MKIPVGFSTQVTAEIEYTISLAKTDGNIIDNLSVYLIDNQEQIITNLSDADYTFKSGEGSFNGRFTVQFEPEILGNNDISLETITVFPNPADDILTVQSPNNELNSLVVYNLQGRKVIERSDIRANSVVLDISALESSIYLLKVVSENRTVTKRIIKR